MEFQSRKRIGRVVLIALNLCLLVLFVVSLGSDVWEAFAALSSVALLLSTVIWIKRLR